MVSIGETLHTFSKAKKKFVTVFLAEGNTKDRNGVGIADEYLEEFGKQFVRDNITHTSLAFPTAGHPKFQTPPVNILQSGNLSNVIKWYKGQLKDLTIGKYVHTFIRKNKETGKRMLLGIFQITDPNYSKMWEEGKFPKWNSTSIYELNKNKDGFITNAIPIDNCSVNDPMYGYQKAGVYHVCEGNSECVAQSEQILKQSGNLCKDRSVKLFTEFYDTNNPHISLNQILQSGEEDYLTNSNDNNNNADNSNKTLPDSTQKLISSEEDDSKKEEGQPESENPQNPKSDNNNEEGQVGDSKESKEKDWKAYAMELESKLKQHESNIKDKFVSKKDFDVIRKELRYNKVSTALKTLKESIPDIFANDKEFSEKLDYFNNLKMSDDEVLEHIRKTTEMYAPLIKENKKLKQSGDLTPFGLDVTEISNKLKSSGNKESSDNNKDKVILMSEW